MPVGEYEVVVIGAGIAGLVTTAILAKQGKKVLLIEKDDRPGGRAAVFHHQGYKLQVGAHLSEDSGSGTTKIMEYLGKTFEPGPENDNMPVYHEGQWLPMHEVIGADKAELKKVIKELVDMDFSALDDYEDLPLRTWILERTQSEGVARLFEFIAMVEGATRNWLDHSASENLFIRKIHLQEKRTTGYSFWPKQGWDGFFKDLEEVIRENGGVIEYNLKATRIVVEDGEVRGVRVQKVGRKAIPNEFVPSTLISAGQVVCTIPVWDVREVLPTDQIPSWYLDKIDLVAKDDHRAIYLGLYAACDKPIYAYSERELAAWFHGPVTGYPGWGFLNSALDASVAPPGKHLWVCGVYVDPEVPKSRTLLEKTFADIEKELEEMFPAFKDRLWVVRHVVFHTTYVANKPGLMGKNRPANEIPGIRGLYFAGDSFQGRAIGTDRAARQGLAAAERVLGFKIPGFENTLRV